MAKYKQLWTTRRIYSKISKIKDGNTIKAVHQHALAQP